jgi:hypothetical protein
MRKVTSLTLRTFAPEPLPAALGYGQGQGGRAVHRTGPLVVILDHHERSIATQLAQPAAVGASPPVLVETHP